MALSSLLVGAVLAAGTQGSATDWPSTLLMDLEAADAALRDSHPGVVDPHNPGFVAQMDGALSVYMDIRPQPLPSGLSRISVPMKVYRGRGRGSNEPYVPDRRYAGDMRDTQALEAWILEGSD